MADERYSTESNGRAGAGGVQTRGKSLLKGKKKTLRSLLVTAPPRLPQRPKIENISEEKNTSEPGNALANIVAGYKPKPPANVVKTEIAIEEVAEVVKTEPESLPVQPLVIPAPELLPPIIETPTRDIGVQTPMQKRSPSNLRPDGVTEILGPGGVVLEEIGEDGRVIVDPIKDVGFDPKDPPSAIKKLREDFREHVVTGKDEAGEVFKPKDETIKSLKDSGLERFIPKVPKPIITPKVETESGGRGGQAKEKIITNGEAQQKLTPRDFVATITEVLDSNRVRVSLSFTI